MRACTIGLAATLCFAACSSEDKKPSAEKTLPARDGAALALGDGDAAAPVAQVQFSDTTAGLEQLIRELGSATTPAARTEELVASLSLTTPETWFQKHFGAGAAAALVTDYDALRPHLPELAQLLREQYAAERTRLLIERFDGPEDTAAVGYQKIALAVAKAPLALYSVRLRGQRDDDVFHVWSFIHDGTTFRWVGKLSMLSTGDAAAVAPGAVDPMEFRVRDAARAKRLTP